MAQEYNKKGLEEKIIRKAWEDAGFKKVLLENPKEAIEKELQVAIPADIEIKVVEETPKTVYLVLPASPLEGAEENTGLEPRAMTYV